MADYRHHHVVLVPVPVEAGSPESIRQSKPPAYKRDRLGHWRPQRDTPARLNKAEALRRLLDAMRRQNEEVRAFMEARRRAA
jgi:hypothetical protein